MRGVQKLRPRLHKANELELSSILLAETRLAQTQQRIQKPVKLVIHQPLLHLANNAEQGHRTIVCWQTFVATFEHRYDMCPFPLFWNLPQGEAAIEQLGAIPFVHYFSNSGGRPLGPGALPGFSARSTSNTADSTIHCTVISYWISIYIAQ